MTNTPLAPSALLTTGQVARLAQCSAEAVRYHTRKGTLGATKTANGWRLYRREDAEAFAALMVLNRQEARC